MKALIIENASHLSEFCNEFKSFAEKMGYKVECIFDARKKAKTCIRKILSGKYKIVFTDTTLVHQSSVDIVEAVKEAIENKTLSGVNFFLAGYIATRFEHLRDDDSLFQYCKENLVMKFYSEKKEIQILRLPYNL